MLSDLRKIEPPAGATAGMFYDANMGLHGFMRTPDGLLIDAPGAVALFYAGTVTASINPSGAITGHYEGLSDFAHGFLRYPDGTFTTFDARGLAIT